MMRLAVTIYLILDALLLFPRQLHLTLPKWPVSFWSDKWYGTDHFGTERARVESGLEQLPGQQLVIVRYSARHNRLDEWVYNSPDIYTSKVVWAREMDTAHNLDMVHYYADRKVWLVEPGSLPVAVLRYPATQEAVVDLH